MNEANDNIDITIDLSRSTYPNINHESNELIQQEAIKKLRELIDKTLKIVRNPEPYNPALDNEDNEGEHFRRRHEAITILGERGTGKTNFLVNLKSILNNNNGLDNNDCKYESLVFLRILDPTLFEDRQNILIAIISMIHLKVDKYKRNHEVSKADYDIWRKVLVDLAEGLNLLDGVGHNPMQKDLWDDARIILEKGLNAAHSGHSFEKNFHLFVYRSIKLIKGEMFILRLDDIDTNLEKGWPVLEVIRKYLTTPHLQVIISGDWKLYSKIVRIKQWEQLEKLNERENKNLIPTIDSLEEQYLSKILKPSNRIFLKSIKGIVYSTSKHKYNIFIKDDEKSLKKHIKEVYSDIFSQVFKFPKNYIETYSNLLMSFPIRTNIQILTTYAKSIENDKIDKKVFIDGAINTFLTVSERSGFSYRDFQKIYEPIGYTFLATRLYKNELKNIDIKSFNLLSMEPNFENNDLNVYMMLLGAVIVDTLKEYPNRIIDWFYRIEYLELIKRLDIYDTDTIMQYLDYQKRISVYENVIKINGLLHKNSKVSGFAKFYGHQRQIPKNMNEKLAYYEIFKRINNDYYSDKDDVNKLIILLLSIVTKKVIVKKESSTNMYISFHYLLGFLGRLLAGKSSKELLSTISDDTKIFALSEKNIDSFVFYGKNILDENEIETESSSVVGNILNKDTREAPSALSSSLDKWIKKKNFLDSSSLIMLRNVWKEFVSNEESMDNCSTLQEYLEVQLYIFLNSLIKAESKEQYKAESYENIYNKKHAKQYFIKNLLKLRGETKSKKKDYETINEITKDIEKKIDNGKTITLLEYFVICPLWDYYLNFNVPQEIPLKQSGLLTMAELGGNHYYRIFETLALHTEGKSSETNQEPNLTFKQIVIKVIEENKDLIDNNDLEKSLEKLIRNDQYFKASKFRWSPNRERELINIYHSIID